MTTLKQRPKKLLAIGTNSKTVKSDKASEYLTAIMYLSPHKNNSSNVNLCPKASTGCSEACLYTAGRGAFSNVQKARTAKSEWFLEDRKGFVAQLHKEILALTKSTELKGKKLAVRLNGTSDILWGRLLDMSQHPTVQFYDYTKYVPSKRRDILTSNYNVTFSRAEDTTDKEVKKVLSEGYNVAVVFDKLPKSYLGYPVFNGDTTDLRFLDPTGHVIGLIPKGAAKKDTSGFVVRPLKTIGDIL